MGVFQYRATGWGGMAGGTLVTVVGNLTADPELRYTTSGIPVAGFTVYLYRV